MKQRMIFVVGCARSGTTWLQLLLSQHPAIATLQESHLFTNYISPALERWRRESEQKDSTGMTSLMDRAQFIQLWRQFAEGTFGVAVVEKPNASFILEKTPNHVHTAPEILELFPEAYFVHIIRDPRAVVASMLDASRSWGKGWAPRTAVSAAEAWREAVLDGRQIKNLTGRYTEVSYEAMLAGPESALARVLEMLGLGPDPEFCSQAAKTCAAPNMGKGTWKAWVPKSLESIKGIMVRKGQADGWRNELSRFQINAVEYVTRDLLSSFGYEPMIKPKLLTTVRLTSSGVLAKFSHAVGRRLRGALKGV